MNRTERTWTIGRLEAVLALLGFAYLGFWFYGLVMGVFAIDELIPFTIVAALIVALTAFRALRTRRAQRQGRDERPDEIVRASRHQREIRGY